MKWIVYGLLLWWVGSSSVKGGEPLRASYRVSWFCGNEIISGSATAISEIALVSCSHVFEHRAGIKDVVVRNHAGKEWRGWVVSCQPGCDVSLIQLIPNQPPLEYVELGEDPKLGDVLITAGYGTRGSLRSGKGTAIKTSDMRQGGVPVIETSVALESGDSGGGTFDLAGRLVAVNWGNAGHAHSTPVSYVKECVRVWETQYCPNGQCRPLMPQYYQKQPATRILPWRQGVEDRLRAQPMKPSQPVPQAPVPQAPPVPNDEEDDDRVPPAPEMPACDLSSVYIRLDAQQRQMVEILAKLNNMPAGPKGDKGDAGPIGPQGPKGDPGTTPVIDYDLLTKEVIKRLPPSPVSYDIRPRKKE